MKQLLLASVVVLAVGCSSTRDSGAIAVDGSAGGAVAFDGRVGGVVALNDSAGGSAAPDGSTCGTHKRLDAQLVVDTLGLGSGPYDGRAIVERSTPDELILVFALPTSTSDAADTTAMHAKLSGLDPMPILPRGAKVWLSKNPAGNPPTPPSFSYYLSSSWALTVRDRQGGTILFGAARNAPDRTSTPVATGKVTPICVSQNPECQPAAGNKITYSAVEVLGDTPVTIADNQTATVRLGGVNYNVSVTAQEATLDPSGCKPDYFAYSEVSVDVQAKDLQSLINTLEVGVLPECVEGNDRQVPVILSLTEVQSKTTYDGPVFFQGRDASNGIYDGFMFSIVGLTSVDVSSPPPQLRIDAFPGIFPEPKVGDEFWATIPNLGNATLRESRGGPLVLAEVFELGASTSTAASIEQLLGVAVEAKQRCNYAVSNSVLSQNGILSLWDVQFLTTPPVVVQSDSLGALQLGGKDYAVLVSGEGPFPSFWIYAR